ncbi:MAG: hypothetical protein LKK08_04200 [Bacteroidales bacterium]|nr:hypothetical protein [Bacteroidales bacterium]MCI2145431.1 hypothetical protein [Bacteroidales bacterium]
MNRKFALIILFSAVVSFGSYAQNGDKHLNDFDYVKFSDAWLTSQNASGLGVLPVSDMTYVEVSGTKSNGSFVNYDGSPDSYCGAGRSESFVRLNPKTVLYGRVSYDYFHGKDMGGSAFVNPYFNSVNIVEYSDTTRGPKLKETYSLSGGVGCDLTDDLSIGIRADYDAVDYAKTKDLRYVDNLMDMKFTAGAKYRLGFADIGLNYYYRRRVEYAKFEVEGTTDNNYYSLIDYGGFFGDWELFGESGVTSSSYKAPELSQLQGGSLQLGFRLGDAYWFNEFSLRSRNGYLGSTSSARIMYYEHSGMEAEYNGRIGVRKGNSMHALTLKWLYATLQNNQDIYNMVTDNTVTTVYYYGSNRVGDRISANGSLEYAGDFGIRGNYPVFTVKAGADAFYLASRTSVYPNYRDREIASINGRLSGTYNMIGKEGICSFALNLGYGAGSGEMKSDGTYNNPSAVSLVVRSTDFNLEREYEYFTAGKFRAGAALKYSRFLSKGMTVYAELSDDFLFSPKAVYLGKTANVAMITVGLGF